MRESRNHDVLLRMLHRFDLLVPSRASGQRHVVPWFNSRWYRKRHDGGVSDDEGRRHDEGGDDSRKKLGTS